MSEVITEETQKLFNYPNPQYSYHHGLQTLASWHINQNRSWLQLLTSKHWVPCGTCWNISMELADTVQNLWETHSLLDIYLETQQQTPQHLRGTRQIYSGNGRKSQESSAGKLCRFSFWQKTIAMHSNWDETWESYQRLNDVRRGRRNEDVGFFWN